MAKKIIIRSIRIDTDTDEAIQAEAIRLGISYSECLRRYARGPRQSAEPPPAPTTTPSPPAAGPGAVAEPRAPDAVPVPALRPREGVGKLDILDDPLRGGLHSTQGKR